MTVSEKECALCKEGLHLSINSVKKDIHALRRELTLAVGISTTLIGIFILILGFIIKG